MVLKSTIGFFLALMCADRDLESNAGNLVTAIQRLMLVRGVALGVRSGLALRDGSLLAGAQAHSTGIG